MIILDYKDRRPLYEQVVEKFGELIIKGILQADTQLPSVRNLAMELSINPNTIQRAYAELEHKGLVYVIKGKGNFVCNREEFIMERKQEVFEELAKVISEAYDAGINREELIEHIDLEYRREKND